MSFNLYPMLSEQDKTIMKNYIFQYGIKEEHFIGLEEWLTGWSYNKIKLYKLLGNSFTYSTPFKYEEPYSRMVDNFERLIYSTYGNFTDNLRQYWIWKKCPDEDEIGSRVCYQILSPSIYARNAVDEDIVLDFLPNKKKVVLSKGMKPIKALYKYLKYVDYDDMEAYEQFRLEHSRVLNTKTIQGELVISIHPMDFMTMSDNSYNWSSCMNWTEGNGGGCYKIGSEEMMFSNCVVCCYLKTKEPFYFNNSHQDEEHSWTNKKWRQLFYVTKDIIVSGKSYPYASEEITKELLKTLQDLAKKNLNWEYRFGPELYTDMKHVYSDEDFDFAREDSKQHRILFDVRGMYNDFANDHHRPFWCIRNKVKKNKIINISGKSSCLCCGDEVATLADYYDEYNDKYNLCDSLICAPCTRNNFTCEICNCVKPYATFTKVNGSNICSSCLKDFKKCPSNNGAIFNIQEMYESSETKGETLVFAYVPRDEYSYRDMITASVYVDCSDMPSEYLTKQYGFTVLFMSKENREKLIKEGKIVKTSEVLTLDSYQPRYYWETVYDYWIWKEPISLDDKEISKYFYENLKNAYC